MKKQKSLFLLFMALVMMAMSPQSVWAWGGSGTSSSPYTIGSAADLQKFANIVNGTNGEPRNVAAWGKLTADIDLNNAAWKAMGSSSYAYTGTFDGQGHTISGLNLTATAANAGLFGYVNGATIKNFSLAGTVSSGYDNTGSVVGYAKGSSTIQDIVSTVNITMTAAKIHLGGIAGNIENGTSVLGCTYSGTLNAGSSTDSNGGIVGFANANCSGTIKYCFFNGTVKTTGSGPVIGGILGYTNDESNNFGGVQDCYSCGTLTYSGSDTHVNAIVGRIRNRATTTINNTYLSGIATRACNTDGPSIPASNKAITISVTADNNTYGSVTQSYVNPTSTTATMLHVEAKSNYGYKFDKWKDENTQATRDVALSDNVSLQATFSIKTCTIKVVVDDASRGYAYIGMSGVTSVTVDQGTEVTIVARVRVGFEFLYWTDNSTESEHKITADYDRTYTAYFRTARYYITVEAGEHGSVDRTSGEREHGTNMYVTATPDEGYHFEKWSDGNTTNPRNIHVTAPGTYKAIFAPNKYTISVNTANSYMGTVSGGGTFNYGSTKTITATPKTGYRFVEWNDGNTNASRQITVTEDKTYTATFAIYQHTITVKTNDSNYGTVSGGGTYDHGSEQTITATPKNNYHFVQWNDGNTNASRQITVTGDAAYTATFAIDQHTITVNTANSDMGTVSGGGTYDHGSEQTITATPKEHYLFEQWSDGNTDASRQITVTEDKTYTANFIPALRAKAVLNEGILTFYYDEENHVGNTFLLNTGTNTPDWYSEYNSISTVVFDANFAAARPTSCYRWFVDCKNLTSIQGLEYLNTSNVTDMSYMFRNCSSLQSLDLSSFNTSNVTNMSEMFSICSSLQSLDLSSFNTSNVTDMMYMFSICSSLQSLDLSSFNTENVTTMAAMFYNCSSLWSLDLSSFNTSNVTDMSYMFRDCSSLQSLDLSSFNTSNVTNMSYMFRECSSLQSLDLSSFNTSNVTDMREMFRGCGGLSSLTIGNFDMQKATTSYTFGGCPNLNTLTLKSLPYLSISSDENTPWDSFEAIFSGAGKTVNYELDDNSVIYTGATNYLPAASSASYTRQMTNEWGTVVVPFEIVYNSNNGNYKLYQFESLNVYNIYFREYTTGDVIAAGTPMAVKAVGSKNAAGKYEIVLEGNGTISTEINTSGDPVTFYMNGTYTALSNQTDIHFIAQNQFWWADAPITIAPFRAWIEEGEDSQPEYPDEPEPEPNPDEPDDDYELNHDAAPARLNIVVINNDEQTATWLGAINATDAKATKVMIDGQMFILKNGQMFDICGRKIK